MSAHLELSQHTPINPRAAKYPDKYSLKRITLCYPHPKVTIQFTRITSQCDVPPAFQSDFLFSSVPGLMDKEQRLLKFLSAAFGDTPPADIKNSITEDATFCGPITGGRRIPMLEWAEFSHVIRGLVGPATFEPLNVIAQGDWLSLRLEIKAECLVSGKTVTGYDCLLVRFEGDRIAEYIGHMDYLTFFEQLELVPSGALHACLSGQRLTWKS